MVVVSVVVMEISQLALCYRTIRVSTSGAARWLRIIATRRAGEDGNARDGGDPQMPNLVNTAVAQDVRVT